MNQGLASSRGTAASSLPPCPPRRPDWRASAFARGGRRPRHDGPGAAMVGSLGLYVDSEGIETTLPPHPPRDNEPYLLGIFLVGAYQEILGGRHNLFGDTDSVHVELKPDGSHRLLQPQRGDTVDSVLRYVHFNADDLLASYRAKIERAKSLSPRNREAYLTELAEGLKGYTYLED
ncbi:MAG: hypothetical protein WD823_09205 [Sulfuricaulis sp.]